jgi:hypothetical protein
VSTLNETVVKAIAEKHSVTPAQVRCQVGIIVGTRCAGSVTGIADPDLHEIRLDFDGVDPEPSGRYIFKKSVEIFYFELLDFSLLKPLGYIVSVLEHKK